MLQQIRDKITGWFAAVFLGAIAVVFVFWGIQFESSSNVAAAKVNGESISAEQVRRAWQQRQTELQQAMRDELPPALVKEEQTKLLNDSVRREVLVQHVDKMGYRVSDQAIVSQLEQIPALQVDGKFSRDRYAALLRQQGTLRSRVRGRIQARPRDRAAAERHRHLGLRHAGRGQAPHRARGRDPRDRLRDGSRGEVRRAGGGQPGGRAGRVREEQGELQDRGDGVAAVRAAEARRRRGGRGGDRGGPAAVLRAGRSRALPGPGATPREAHPDRVRHRRRGGEEEGGRRLRAGQGRRGLREARDAVFGRPRFEGAGRRTRLVDARVVRQAFCGCAVRDAGGRDPGTGEDAVRLPRDPARGSPARLTSAASTRCARSSRPSIATTRRSRFSTSSRSSWPTSRSPR